MSSPTTDKPIERHTDTTLTPDRDPMGAAISDHYATGHAARLRVLSTVFDEDEMPVSHLFRTFDAMPRLERKAMKLSRGRVLDVGAGAGCHALELQRRGLDVTAIDISPLSCATMRKRGVANVTCTNLFSTQLTGEFDTILLLMNGTGIAGRLSGLQPLLLRLRSLLAAGGQVLIDSSDLKYIYENEDGSLDIDLNGPYYGEVDYQMVYKDIKGEPFDWLYVDFPLLKSACTACSLTCELVEEGPHYDYLARLTAALPTNR